MPRMFLILSFLFACLACNPEAAVEPESQTRSFQATLSGGIKSKWLNGDKVSVISVKSGAIASVDSFTAKGEGQTAQFTGTYTGSEDASVAVVYPAMESRGGQIYESAALFGNENGFFRAVKGAGYLLFAPKEGMTVKQSKNAGVSDLESLDFRMAGSSAKALFGQSVSLQEKTVWLKLNLNASAIEKGESVQSVRLALNEGTPFSTYRGSMALDASKTAWTSDPASGSFKMELGGFEPGNTLTVFVPVFPSNGNATLSGSDERSLAIEVSTGAHLYSASIPVPAQSDDYKLVPGKPLNLQATLKTQSVTPPEGPVIGTVKKVLDKGIAAVCVDGDILYAGRSGLIYALDISKPMEPALMGSVAFPGSPRQMVAYNGKLVVSARATGVWVFDISNPADMTVISRYDGIELSTGIDMAGDCIFVGERQTGVEFVDARNLSKPQHIRVIKTPESQTVFYAGGYLYSGEWAAGQVTVFDARDLSNIQQVATMNLKGYGDGLWVSGNRLYASTGHHHRNDAPQTQEGDGHGVEIWDISNPSSPKFISRTEFDKFYVSGIDYWMPRPSGDGRTLFCADVFNGLYVLDIRNEYKPSILYHWEPEGNTPTNKKNAITSMALGNGAAYVAVSGEGLYAMESSRAKPCVRERGTLPTNLQARYTYSTPSSSHFNAWIPDQRGAVKGAAAYGNALFVACGDAGLYTVMKDILGKPYATAHLDIPFAGGVAVRGDKLYVARGYEGLGVYRIGADLSLTQIALLKQELNPSSPADQFSYWVSAPNDQYVVNGCRSSGYQFLAVEGSSASPAYTFRRQYGLNLNYNRYISEQCSSEGLLPYATRSGLVWINLSSTASVPVPVVYDQLKNSLTQGATLYKNNQILLTRGNSLCTIAPGGSEILATSEGKDGFSGIPRWESGNTVLVCNFVNRFVSKINTANFASPTLQFKEETIGYPEPGIFWNGKCVVPCGYQGLLIEK